MVVSTGPFDWWASMIGLTLLAVLWGYAHEPTSRQESVGLSAAIALAVVYTVGAPLEIWFDAGISGDGENGDIVLVMWLVMTAVTCGILEARRARRGVAQPTTIRFARIGDVFPADDAVARFLTVVAMMSNDWVRLIYDMLALDDDAPDAVARRIMSFRQQAALHDEAARFIADARRRFPEVDAFIQPLDRDAQSECDQIVGGIDPRSPHYHGEWLTDHRNITFHYPEMHPDKAGHGTEEITEALKAAAEHEGTITFSQGLGSVRFGFADEVAVQWLPDVDNEVHLIETLRESVMALARFAQRAIAAYLESRPDDAYTVEATVRADNGGR